MFGRFKKGSGNPEQPSGPDDGTVLLGGAYRSLDASESEKFTALAREAFPEFSERIRCFGSDWLGRLFAFDSARVENGRELVLMLEPGTGEALEIPCDGDEFLAVELIEYSDAVVALDLFHEWQAQGGAIPSRDQCVGYRQPLFLGGADDLSNLELSDMEVYWSIMGQMLDQTRGLPPGTRIGSVTISD